MDRANFVDKKENERPASGVKSVKYRVKRIKNDKEEKETSSQNYGKD
jgi:hypothetical protein